MPAVRARHPPARPHQLDLSTPSKPAHIAIIAPTPRQSTFSFPAAHNLADAPYASPSNSPFESGLAGLAISSAGASPSPSSPFSPDDHDDGHAASATSVRIPPPLPLSAYTRTLTPVYTPTILPSTPSPFPSGPSPSPGRRRNVSADPAERRPKRGDADYVKRPENAFILFRRQACADRASALSDSSPSPAPAPLDPNAPAPITLTGLPAKARQADLSKAISAQWRALPAEERAKWEARAAEKKREHEEKHPGYVYRPRKKPPKGQDSMPIPEPMLPVPAAPHPMGLGLAPSVEFVLPAPRLPVASGSRSSSVPPASYPYQHVQVPDVYASQSPYGASASTDGAEYSLLPLIMSSAASKSQESTNLGGFDYLPASGNGGGNLGAFEANLMASDFLRSMFANPLPPSLPAPTTFALDAQDLSPASSPEPELATPGPAPGLSPGQPQPHSSFDFADGCASPESWPAHSPRSSASALLSPASSSIPSPWPSHAQYTFPSLSLSSDGVSIAHPDAEFAFPNHGTLDFDFDLASVPAPTFGFAGEGAGVGDAGGWDTGGLGYRGGGGMEGWDGRGEAETVDPMQLDGARA